MKSTLTTLIVIAAMAVVAPAVAAHKPMQHAHHAKAGCKGEFMYMKGGKCMDARAKA